MRLRLSTPLNAPPEWVAAQLQSTAVFRHIAAPLVLFRPTCGTPWPAHWSPGDLQLQMRLLGLLPMGSQTVRISIEPSAQAGGWPTLRDNGEGALMRRWDHRITLQPLPDGHTLYTDDIDVVARHLPWLMTPLSGAFAQVFYRHRQRRWRQLAARRAADPMADPLRQQRAFDHLLAAFDRDAGAPPATRWRWLEAAHVLGQSTLSLHWRSHRVMLRYALQLRDLREAGGQVLRLALVPLGHLLARLPIGNTGRARVSALAPMAPQPHITRLINEALAAASLPALNIWQKMAVAHDLHAQAAINSRAIG